MGVGRRYERERDLDAVTRIWREVGWIDHDDEDDERALDQFLSAVSTLVADVDGAAECAVSRSTGSIRHLETDLPLCLVAAVTTSHVGRRRGMASALTTETLAEAADEGAAVAALGMFDQGFYDRFGFGTGTYEHRFTFDPTALRVAVPDITPVRLTVEDADEMHDLLRRRHRGHGSVVVDPPAQFAAEVRWTDKRVALGHRAADGRLTGFVLGTAKQEYGPYEFEWLVAEDRRGLLDLLGLIRGLGDQVGSVTLMSEPPDLQIQDLIDQPMRRRRNLVRAGGAEVAHVALAEQQYRIMDVRACVEATHLTTPPVAFGLRLHDPVSEVRDTAWEGIGGEYTVRFGPESTASDGLDPDLPVLEATVNAFSRLWLGVRSASALALTDRLSGPPDLLAALDRSFCLPTPFAGWII